MESSDQPDAQLPNGSQQSKLSVNSLNYSQNSLPKKSFWKNIEKFYFRYRSAMQKVILCLIAIPVTIVIGVFVHQHYEQVNIAQQHYHEAYSQFEDAENVLDSAWRSSKSDADQLGYSVQSTKERDAYTKWKAELDKASDFISSYSFDSEPSNDLDNVRKQTKRMEELTKKAQSMDSTLCRLGDEAMDVHQKAETQRAEQAKKAEEAAEAQAARQDQQTHQNQRSQEAQRSRQSQQQASLGNSNGRSAYYKNCDAVRAAGKAPLYQDEPGYEPRLDADGDGVACEPYHRHHHWHW